MGVSRSCPASPSALDVDVPVVDLHLTLNRERVTLSRAAVLPSTHVVPLAWEAHVLPAPALEVVGCALQNGFGHRHRSTLRRLPRLSCARSAIGRQYDTSLLHEGSTGGGTTDGSGERQPKRKEDDRNNGTSGPRPVALNGAYEHCDTAGDDHLGCEPHPVCR